MGVYKCKLVDTVEFYVKADNEEDAMDWLQSHTTEAVMKLTSDCKCSFNEYIEEAVDGDIAIDISSKREEKA